MSDNKLTRQDEDISAPEFEAEEQLEHYDFGNWPEALGVIISIVLIWLMFSFNG